MPDRESPIGVFDSGVGGIATLAVLRRVLPGETFLYYGDTANAPYGTRPVPEVLACVNAVVDTLLARDIKALVIACNTATSVAAPELRARLSVPVIGMEPALKPAALARGTGSILVMATPNTLALPKFRHLLEQWGQGAEPLPCPGLMELVEADDEPATEAYLKNLFAPYDLSAVDGVVLGCTHYVFLRPVLRRMLPAHVGVFDGNLGTARQLERVLRGLNMLSVHEKAASEQTFMTSGKPETVLPVMERLWRRACSFPEE